MRYNTDTSAVELTATELCQAALRTGSLSYYAPISESGGISAELLAKLRHDTSPAYTVGAARTVTHLHKGICYQISGQADGVFVRDEMLFVDEIRTVRNGSVPAKPSDRQMIRLRLHAWMEAVADQKDSVTMRLVYQSISDGTLQYREELCQTEWLNAYVDTLLCRVGLRANYLIAKELEYRPATAAAPFPFPDMREGQGLLIREVFRDIRHGKRLFAQAPTGIGKTISVLYPSVRALGSGEIDQIFYLTAKASTRREAFRAVKKLYEAGAKLKVVILYAKEQMCSHPDGSAGSGISRCTPDRCPLARGYYDRSHLAVAEMISSGNGFTAASVHAMAKKYQICPYELSLDLSEYCDIVICDYNYVFDPIVRLRRYFGDGKQGKYVFLVDEAHNLADRAREMYSAEIRLSRFISVAELCGGVELAFGKAFSKLVPVMQRLKKLCADTLVKNDDGTEDGYYVTHGTLDTLLCAVEEAVLCAEKWKRADAGGTDPDLLESPLAELRRFLCIAERYDKGYLTYVEIRRDDVSVRLVCLDPSAGLDAAMGKARSSVLFSATLTPTDYFSDILGGGKDAVAVSLPSPFCEDHLLVCAVDAVSTRYDDRNKSYKRVASCIAATVSAKKGNYIAYFPSYDYLEQVLKIFEAKYPSVRTVVQKRNMNRVEKESFLEEFRSGGETMRVGFCVLGGSFSEGVDLSGDRLIGVVIVGVGLPGLSAERNILREYYDERSENGYEYAYTYPGMNNVLQAAGRVIRTDTDRGVVVLIDDRYMTPQYRALFPEHWGNFCEIHDVPSLAESVSKFWTHEKM